MILLWAVLTCTNLGVCHLHIYCMSDGPFNAWAISLKHNGKIRHINYLPERGGVTGCAGGCPWQPNTAIMCWNVQPIWGGEILDIEFEYAPSIVGFTVDPSSRPTEIGDCLPKQGFEGGGVRMLDEPQAQSVFYVEAVSNQYATIGWAQELPVVVLGMVHAEENPYDSTGVAK